MTLTGRRRDTKMLAPIIFNMTGDTRRVMTSCDPKLIGHPATFGEKYLMSVTDLIRQTPCSFEYHRLRGSAALL